MTPAPDSSAVRTALWRAMHVQHDDPPHLVEDEIGLALADPGPGWQDRPDVRYTTGYRAATVARTRFVEDLITEEAVRQYVLLGAGLDTYAQRHAGRPPTVDVYEVDQPSPQEWKRQRLEALGYGVPDHLHLVPVDFEADQEWWPAVLAAGFDPARPALVSSSGVSMYITEEATAATLRQLTALAPGSIVAMTFMLPLELVDPEDRPGLEGAAKGARASGTPWISFYRPEQIEALAHDAGLRRTAHVSTRDLATRYLAGRTDGLVPAGGEGILLVRT